MVLLRSRLFSCNLVSLFSPARTTPKFRKLPPSIRCIHNVLPTRTYSTPSRRSIRHVSPASRTSGPSPEKSEYSPDSLFLPPGADPTKITTDMILPGSNIVIGPYAGGHLVKDVEFVGSSNRHKDCPKDNRPEFAIVGRSNVGKSSLVNALVHRKDIAITSKKPGRTRLINHFLVNRSWYLVDLPGFGFARASEAAKMDWSAFTKDYFLNRENIVAVLLLVDASIPPQEVDLDCANWLGRNNIPMLFVFTKCDKNGGGKSIDINITNFQKMVLFCYKKQPPWIMTSSLTGQGIKELLLHMSQLRNYWTENG